MKDLRKLAPLRKSETRKKLKAVRLRREVKKLWEELTLRDLYKLYYGTNDEEFRSRIENTIVEKSSSFDDLLEIIENEPDLLQKKAWQKLISRIKEGCIHEKRTKEILFKILKSVPDLRKDAWGILKNLELIEKDFQDLFDLASRLRNSWPEFEHEIAKVQKKKRRKKKSVVEKVQKLINQITKLKKGRE